MATSPSAAPALNAPGGASVAATNPLSPSKEPIKTYPLRYWVVLIGAALLYGGIGGLLHQDRISIVWYEQTLDVGYLIWIVGAAHYTAGIKVVNRTHLGGIFVLGTPTIEVTGRLIIVLWLVCEYDEIELAPIDISVPTSPERVWRGRDGGGKPLPIPVGGQYEEPLRVVFAAREYDNLPTVGNLDLKTLIGRDDPLLKRATEEVSFVVRAAVQPGRFFDFYVRIKDYNNARVQIRALGIAKISEDFNKVSVAEALATLEASNDALEEHLGKNVESWGVAIVNAKITVQLSYSMNSALEKIPQAEAGARAAALTAVGIAEATKTQAGADEIRLTKEGKGRAAATKAEMGAVTASLKKRAKELDLKGVDVLGAETARAIGQSASDKIVLGTGGFIEALGLGKALSKTLGKDSE